MNIVLTGGLGFVGCNVIDALLARDDVDQLIVLDCLAEGSIPSRLPAFREVPVFSWNGGSIDDRAALNTCVAGADVVVHLAAASSVDKSIVAPELAWRTNALGTLNVIESIRSVQPSCTLVHVSTDEVWGELLGDDEADESTAYDPRNPYAASKAAADHAVLSAVNTYGLTAWVVHFTTLFGPWQLEGKLVSTSISNMLAGDRVPLFGTGDQIREYTFVDDAVRGLLSTIDHGKAGERYIFGSGIRLSTRQMVTRIARSLGVTGEFFRPAPDRPGHDFRYAVSSEKAERELGWCAEVGLDEGLERTVEWWRSYISAGRGGLAHSW